MRPSSHRCCRSPTGSERCARTRMSSSLRTAAATDALSTEERGPVRDERAQLGQLAVHSQPESFEHALVRAPLLLDLDVELQEDPPPKQDLQFRPGAHSDFAHYPPALADDDSFL